jgi:hypothetical protein
LRGLGAEALVFGIWVALAAVLERHFVARHAVDVVLIGVVFGVAVPLATWLRASFILRGERLSAFVEGLGVYGFDRRQLALGVWLCLAIPSVLSAIGLSLLGLVLGYGGLSAEAFGDAATTTWIAALGAVAYSTLFFVVSTLGRSLSLGLGVLLVDWLLGSGSSVVALPFPRAHLGNLLGGSAPVDLLQWQSALFLLVLSLGGVAFAVFRLER